MTSSQAGTAAIQDPSTPFRTSLRRLPSVDSLLQQQQGQRLLADFGRDLTVDNLRIVLDGVRQQIIAGQNSDTPGDEAVLQAARGRLEAIFAPTLQPVINATGVIVHTNLGRAPLSEEAIVALKPVAAGYSTLEYDIVSGKRGSRADHAEKLLKQITGSEAALVVNNNAAAVLLMLTALCRGQEVIISRGQLIEIGGGFRIPDVMAQSGATLVEVGTTNRTHLHDYENAITENTAAILVAHHSNYRIVGFTTEPAHADLAALAQAHDLPLLYDQGSGALLDVAQFGLEPEPTVAEGLAAGVDVIAFSGDKLLGGPQAGILCGRNEMIARLKRHPLARAVRADKLCLAALAATLAHYLKQEALEKIPVWQMIARPLASIEQEAAGWAAQLQEKAIEVEVIDGRSHVGGGSLPGTTLPTKLVAIKIGHAEALASRLRRAEPAVIARIQDDRLLVDPRTVLPFQREALLRTLLNNCT